MKRYATLIFFMLSAISTSAIAQDYDAVALKEIKNNIKAYFADTKYQCKELTKQRSPLLNPTIKEIVQFRSQAIAAVWDKYDSEFVDTPAQELAVLAQKGRELELKWRGHIGPHWFRVTPFWDGVIENYSEEIAIFLCAQDISRSLALVAPQVLPKEEDNSFSPGAFFNIKLPNGKIEKREILDATKRASFVEEQWFGEAGIEEALGQYSGPRYDYLPGYFKDVWQLGIVRILRYRKANVWGKDWYDKRVESANNSFKSAAIFRGYNDELDNFPFDKFRFESFDYMKKSKELVHLGFRYMRSIPK